jgi:WD40 repeat protein
MVLTFWGSLRLAITTLSGAANRLQARSDRTHFPDHPKPSLRSRYEMNGAVETSTLPMLRMAACSYEGSLFGWKVEEKEDEEGLLELSSTLTFGFHAAMGSLKAIACSQSGKYLVVGGMDERIRIYDMKDNRSVGELSQHTGAVTSLKFFNDAYLISASEVSCMRLGFANTV